ncbi:MAG: DoxX-like family protein [Verrucomicrobiales bacterium]|nr:DoxX-like family protein [Verrucomicrobiales bacterium]
MNTTENATNTLLWKLKIVCRWSLGLVWIWEGLVPKILAPTELQRQLVERSGLYWPDVDTWLILLGVAMIVAGIIICIGWLERPAVLTASVTMTILIFLVVVNNPDSLKDLHGGIAKDACLYAVAWVVWKLAPIVPARP